MDRIYDQSSINEFRKIIKGLNIQIVHANTIMILDVIKAARLENIKSIIHVREIISRDIDLQNILKGSPEGIINTIRQESEFLICNSARTYNEFFKAGKSYQLLNTISNKLFDLENIYEKENFTVGLISSNIKKKGIEDFLRIAQYFQENKYPIRFALIGGRTELIKKIEIEIDKGQITNVDYLGYFEFPVEAFKTN